MASRPRDGSARYKSETSSPAAELVDGMLSRYVDWRECAAAVERAYLQWAAASPSEEASRFSAYLAALDLEQSSAAGYALAVAYVERSLA